ncbi:MAG: hypothetical protein IJU70_14375 [Lentisphaeria bacterium]|nr:hypothetical protein [Lentisphaeria bacterium]
MKKFFHILSAAFCIAAAAAVLLFAAAYLASRKQAVEVTDPAVKLTPDSGAGLGEDVSAEVDIPLPLCCGVDNVSVTPPPGTVTSGSPLITWHKLRFTGRNWRIRTVLRPVRPGRTAAGKLQFEVRRGGEAPRTFTAAIPEFDVRETVGADKLELASAVEVRKGFPRRLGWLLPLAVLAAAGLVLYLKRPRKIRELTEWERTVREFTDLKKQISSGALPPDRAFIGLVELMRRYLERRFGLPVTRRTAQEFITIMDRCGDRLPEESRPFLREFLTTADLVKFAKVVPEASLVDRSAENAELFITHTRPESEVKNV